MNKNLATVLVIDGGGRGSVLVDKYLQSPKVGKVLAAPGNDLVVVNTKKPVKIFPDIKTTDVEKIIAICKRENIDLVDVAQDEAVAAGLTDALQKESIRAFGPTKLAGQIEWDKAWAREFMQKASVPIPFFKVCKSEEEGIAFIDAQKEGGWFIKAAGLAQGKGVIHALSKKDAIGKMNQMKNFGESGETFLIEEPIIGEEFSSYAIVDGENIKLLGHAQDHKTIFNADHGPNTGGMGSTSTPLCITKKIEKQIEDIFKKTAKALVALGRPYQGILYLGGMINKQEKVFVIEFNARWGDPEAEVIIPSIKNDFYQLAIDTLEGKLNKIKIEKDSLYRIVVTAASRGYPEDYSRVKGKQIFGLERFFGPAKPGPQNDKGHVILRPKGEGSHVKIFGSGVKVENKKYFANGGRLFHLMASGKNILEARQKAYSALSQIYIEGNNLHYRTDIGWRDVERLTD